MAAHTTIAATANVAPGYEGHQDDGFHPVTVIQSCADRLEDEERETLIRHTSKLPALFYLLSFAPPLPSLLREPRSFFDHPTVLYALGTLFAIIAGFSGFPVFDMLYGVYWTNRISGGASADQIRHASNFAGIILFSTAICSFIFTWAFQVCFAKASSQLSQRMRHAYVAAVLAQDASYFDHHGAGEVATFAGKEMNTVRTALGEKMGMTIMLFTILVASLIVGFSICARVTGFLFAVVPILVALFALLAHASDKVSAPALRYEGRASSFLEEIMSSMRIVQSFNMAKPLLSKYNNELLRKVEQYARRKALVRGGEAGIVYFSLFLTYSAAFWWVGHELVRGKIPIGDGLTSFWNLINSLFAFSTAVPQLAAVLEAMTVIKTLRRAIERQPRIDVRETGGVRVEEHAINPEFVLHDVTLAYPSRPSIPSLKEVSMTLQAGKVTALVGPSGSGKSTITSLLLREYDPETANVMLPSDEKDLMIEHGNDKKKKKSAKKQNEEVSTVNAEKEADRLERAISGEHTVEDEDEKYAAKSARGPVRGGGHITYSGVDTRKLNLRWLRSQVAIVRQNPQIFSATVFENVAAGLSGTRWAYRPNIDDAPDASEEIKQRTAAIREKVRSALAKAQALDFVERLPEGLDTLISGGKTGILSGGQRQRLSLARVLVREPRVLIIDEGTSAIDTNTEDRIRLMLEQEHATRGMTTILIAHRLSTVEKADKIVVMRNGRVVDQGTHAELMERKRSDQTYREMVMHQRAILDTDADSDDIEADRRVSRDPSPSGSDSSNSERNETRGREEVLSDTSTKYVAASTIYPLHTDEDEMRKRQDARPTLTARRSRRASDHTSWTVSGRNLATSNQLEHSAESAKNAVDLHKGIYSSNKRKEGEEGREDVAIDAGSDQSTHRTKMQLFKNFLQVLSIVKFEFGCGVLGAFLAGGLFPLSGWVTGKAVNALNSPTNAEITSGTQLWSLIFLCIAIAGLILITLQSYLLESASERITRFLKGRSLGALMEQEIGFFDRAEASSGALASSVSTYPASLTAATGLILSQVLISLSNLFGSVLLAFILSWRGALVIMAPVVLLFFSGWINISMLEKYESTLLEPAAQGASYIAENVDAIKEISALGRERETLRLYDERTHVQTPKQTRYLIWGGGGYAFSQSVVYATGALVFYYGGSLLADRTASFTEVYAIFEAAIIGVFAAGRIFQFTGDFSRAISAFKAMCDWFDRKPQIAYLPPEDGDANKLKRDWPNEDIVFTDVELRYPRRPNHPAIRNLNLRIHANQHQAFCGTSGSGKSTILQMVQRFYDPYRGTITVGDCDIRRIELLDLRKTMSYVSQDACLYEGSIKFNLLLGAAEGQTVSDEELESACQDACIADFINGLPDGWETDIGAKGTQLSGGQRQRICIARALIKKPRILLLDEATSALDAQAEVSVQKALDNASKGRTTLTVAHRLSTIRNADVIHVVEDGAIVESGSHDQLIARRGRYLELVQAQL